MSESMAVQQQGWMLMSVAHISTREHGGISGGAVVKGPHGYSGTVQSYSPLQWLWGSRELASPLTGGRIPETRPYVSTRHTVVELASGGKGMGTPS